MDKWTPIVRATDLILDALFEAGRMEVTVGLRAVLNAFESMKRESP